MRALVWHGKKDIRCDTRSRSRRSRHPRDAIVKVTSCAICGSDLHLYDGFMPGMESGDIMGHEFMGEVVEVGRGERQAQGRRPVVVPFTIICGECEQCRRGNLLGLRALQPQQGDRRQGVRPHHGRPVRLHASDRRLRRAARPSTCACPSPTRRRSRFRDGLTDEQVLFLGDILPTGWQAAVQCDIQPHRHGRDLGLRTGRPDGDPQRRAARRQAGRRDRPGARAPRHGASGRRDHDRLRRRRAWSSA